MTLNLSISPCPNDTFMFDALIHGRIDTEGLSFNVTFADIEQLNSRLIVPQNGQPAVSKASYAILPLITDRYCALHSGSALGRGNGPLLITADDEASTDDCAMRIAIPGRHTTANLLLERLFPHLADKRSYLFSDIPHVVAKGECDAGVLIHEGRFVYKSYGLHLMADLGVEWEKRTGLPLPLGVIVVDRSLPDEVQATVDRVLRRSVEYAFAHPDESLPFVRSHAQELDEQVMRSHIDTFVNAYSIDLGEEGCRAVGRLLNMQPEEFLRR